MGGSEVVKGIEILISFKCYNFKTNLIFLIQILGKLSTRGKPNQIVES
jgi:hypothetical protein